MATGKKLRFSPNVDCIALYVWSRTRRSALFTQVQIDQTFLVVILTPSYALYVRLRHEYQFSLELTKKIPWHLALSWERNL